MYIAVDDDANRARQQVQAALNRLYGYFGMPDIISVAVYGPPDACVKGLREVAEAGAELIQLNTLFDEAEQMERLASEVTPRLS